MEPRITNPNSAKAKRALRVKMSPHGGGRSARLAHTEEFAAGMAASRDRRNVGPLMRIIDVGPFMKFIITLLAISAVTGIIMRIISDQRDDGQQLKTASYYLLAVPLVAITIILALAVYSYYIFSGVVRSFNY